VRGEAKFLSHVPYDDTRQHPEAFENEYSRDNIHDSIVKLPGRHYPKLPYSNPLPGQPSRHFPSISNSQHLRVDANDGPRTEPVRTPLSSRANNANHYSRNGNNYHRQNDQQEGKNGNDVEEEENNFEPPEHSDSPYFDRSLARNYTVMEGATAKLRCRVINLGEKIVS